jgi:probable phosphoglycerate mutase
MHNRSATIYLSRHCKTAWNVEGRLQGTIDLPLAEIGIKQAIANVALIRDLGVRRIACSTARRAYETARLYADSLGLPIHNTPGLRELDHGKWEGRKTEELLLDPDSGYANWLSDPGCVGIPGGSESVRAAQQRVAEAVRDAALSFRGESVLIVGHKHIDALLMCALLKEPLARFGSHIVEDALPHLLAIDVIERLCSGGERGATWTSESIPRASIRGN